MDIIVTLTDEQVAVLRARAADPMGPIGWGLLTLDVDLRDQAIVAVATYDRLTAEAEASHE